MALVGQTMGSAFHQFDVNYGQVKQLAIGSALDSEVFLAGGHRWRIKLYPRGCIVSDNGAYLSIYLELLNKSHVKSVNAFFEAFLMDKNGQPSPVDARTRVCSWQTSNWGWDRFIPVVYLEESYVSNGVVSILFAVVVMSDNSIPVPPPDIGKHLGTLLDTMDGADVSFTIDGETFHAHRAVLAARSPVFRAKLYESTSDGATLSITLHKISPKTFRMMLAFIYTDALTEDDESVPTTVFHNLLVAADHYALDRLKHLCAQKLLDDVALDTVLTTLTCAEIYSCPELKNKCLDFIAAKANDNFLFSVDYIQLAVNFPNIIPDLLQRRSNFGYQQQTHQLWPSDMALVGRPMGSEFYLFDVEYDQAKRATIGTAMYSAALSTGGHSWRVNLYPCGRDVADNGAFMSIYLEHLSKSVTNSVNAFFEVSLMDKNGQSFRAGARSGVILFHKQEWGWPQLISLTDLERNYITQGRFRFMCAITVISDNSIRVPPPDLGKQLGLLLECTEGTDVSFIIAGETFRAHRAVLAARSPVFRASLLGTMAEATMPSITIRGITAQVFRIMLQFIYTDAFPGDDELGDSPFRMLVCLLAASGRYALDRLKVWCASKLWDRVAAKTVSITLLVADTYSCLELKERCIEFMLRNDAASSIYLTDGFVQLIRKCPHLVEELQGRRGT